MSNNPIPITRDELADMLSDYVLLRRDVVKIPMVIELIRWIRNNPNMSRDLGFNSEYQRGKAAERLIIIKKLTRSLEWRKKA